MTSIFKEAGDDVVVVAEEVETFVEGVFVDDVKPFFTSALALIERNGGTTLMKIAGDVLPDLVTGQWGLAVDKIVADVTAAGAVLVEGEEQLAASTALQIVQAAGGALTAAGTAATAPAPQPAAELTGGTTAADPVVG